MARTLPRAQKLFALAVLGTVVLSFLPAKWLRWTADIADVISFPMRPFTHLGQETAGRLRPPERSAATETEQRLLEEKERFQRLYYAAMDQVEELERQIADLQRIPAERRAGVNWIIANITASNPRGPGSTVEINRGNNHGVQPGAIAVYGGVHLVGRVVDGVARLHSRVEPITSIDLIGARVFPREAQEIRPGDVPLAQLRTRPGGFFLIENIARDQPVRPGDIVRLDDRDWPLTAQMMIIGEVESVESNDQDPLRSIITVRPRFRLHTLRTILIESRDLANGEREVAR